MKIVVFDHQTLSVPLLIIQGLILWFLPSIALLARHSTASGPCERNFVSNEGTVHSPNFPNNYNANENCTYRITVTVGCVVRLTFQNFNLESHSTCNKDYVMIRDGHDLSSATIGPFCGSTIPGPLVSSGNKVSIHFHADGSNQYSGFSAKFERVHSSSRMCPLESPKWEDLGGDFCYLIEEREELNFNDALYTCHHAGGSLASFHAQSEMDRVRNKLTRSLFYIGLLKNGDGTFEWADQTPLDYLNWNSGEPNNKYEMCAFMYGDSGKWNDIDCRHAYKYICSAQKAVRSSFASALQKVCPSDSTEWKDFGGKFCYIVDTSGNYTWNQALDQCNANGGYLASFHSAEEVSLLLQHTRDIRTNMHIGYEQMADGSFKWVDKTTEDFFNWNTDEPKSTNEKCSEMLPKSGKWSNIPCNKSLGYICSTPKLNPSVTPDGLKMACIGSSDGWTDFEGDFCYIIGNSAVTRNEADQHCKAVGGNLASFHSLNEIERVRTHFDSIGKGLYIGLKRSSENRGMFEWADHTDVDFLNWNFGEPNNRNEICVAMDQTNGSWNDVNCSASLDYLCSRQKVPSCSGDICKNNGQCQEGYNTPPRCICSQYYKGLQCEEVSGVPSIFYIGTSGVMLEAAFAIITITIIVNM